MKIKGTVIGLVMGVYNKMYLVLDREIKTPFCIPLADKFGFFEKPTQPIGFEYRAFMLDSFFEKGYFYQLTKIEGQAVCPVLCLQASLVPQKEGIEENFSTSQDCYSKPYGYFEIETKELE